MNIALILAGGCGSRTEQDIPKQFMNVYDKPLIIYTLENFERHPDIDGIAVVCIEGWHEVLRAYASQYGISKLKWILDGGEDGQESTHKGVKALKGVCEENDIVLVHDAIRPFLPEEIITDAIAKCRRKGSGLSAVRCQETIVRTDDGKSGSEGISRQEIMRVQTPQAYRYGKAVWAYEEADKRGICGEVYINTLMLRLGETVYFSKGTEKNVKITTIDDLEMFKALLKMEREDWIK
ncbi:MAG: 2-C-methyl-D-erythritol 4-phosphate cytidylyltransferase [Lachnospiraceae bacterium]|nr:2-C-methyl-D-erythritol 4-phosphate cytidylyltransferase [Lachnospiraceae bacterium]MDE6184913.1 2-C-methyl-D-erythritol 4-phosphate cytidylyltransferase [Lachnospiraceae bacterium]MDE7286506.1 2-C-methyl-D-erythritol 4-phosphate cytidylyltransferase [Lachnospiraceae bacterium]